MSDQQTIIAVDLGGTQIRVALSDENGHLQRRTATLTRAEEGPEPIIARIIASMRQALSNMPLEQVRGIGVAAPGPLDPWRGVIIWAPNLPGWHNVPLRERLADEFGRPVYLGNDANLAALAEQRFGAGQGIDDLIYITVSTGIGGGIITGGRLLLGSDGFAGEVGHQTLEPHGPRCNCGNIGCLEALASGPAIAREAVRRIQAGESSAIVDMVGGDLSKVTAKEVNEAAQAGDQLAIEVFHRAGFYLGVGIVNLLHLFNPRLIIIGGSVAKAGALLFDPMWETIRERAGAGYAEELRIVPAALGDDVSLLGAVALVLSEQERGVVGGR